MPKKRPKKRPRDAGRAKRLHLRGFCMTRVVFNTPLAVVVL